MKKLLCATLLLTVSVGCAGKHFQPLSKADIAREALFATTLLLDAKQSHGIEKMVGGHEHNFILGEHPTRTELDVYGLLCAIGHGLVTWYLPKGKQRSSWQYSWIGIQGIVLYKNKEEGLRTDF